MATDKDKINKLETLLFKAILGLYDDPYKDYNGLNDPRFMSYVYDITGMSEYEYRKLIETYDVCEE